MGPGSPNEVLSGGNKAIIKDGESVWVLAKVAVMASGREKTLHPLRVNFSKKYTILMLSKKETMGGLRKWLIT